jgi:hypothetical protein
LPLVGVPLGRYGGRTRRYRAPHGAPVRGWLLVARLSPRLSGSELRYRRSILQLGGPDHHLGPVAAEQVTSVFERLTGAGVRDAFNLVRSRPGCVGLAYIRHPDGDVLIRDMVRAGTYEVNVGGRLYPATVHLRPPYNPEGERVKGREP